MEGNNVEKASGFGQNFNGYQHGGNMKPKSKTRDCFDAMFSYVNYDLLMSKLFYFFFFAAFGSLFPLLGVYFKQLGLNPVQTGVLMGFKPFLEYIGVPFWGTLADRWKRWKVVLLFSLFSCVAFTLALAFVQPQVQGCLAANKTGATIMVPPYHYKNTMKDSTGELINLDIFDYKRLHRGYGQLGKSPIPLQHEYIMNAGIALS